MTNSMIVHHALGWQQSPYAGLWLDTADAARVRTAVRMTLSDAGLTVIAGPRGAGKTEAVERALPESVRVVRPMAADVSRLTVGDLEQAIIYDLSQEVPRRSREARARQLRPILGEASRKAPIVLLIEESHRLHSSTLRALKRLREMRWMGRAPLLSVILIGQADLDASPRLDEVRLRTSTVWLEGLACEEAAAYLQQSVGSRWTPAAIEAIAAAPEARNYLDLQAAGDAAMHAAWIAGANKVDLEHVAEATTAGLRQLAASSGLTPAELARETGKTAAQITRALTPGERSDSATRSAIANVLARHRGTRDSEADAAAGAA